MLSGGAVPLRVCLVTFVVGRSCHQFVKPFPKFFPRKFPARAFAEFADHLAVPQDVIVRNMKLVLQPAYQQHQRVHLFGGRLIARKIPDQTDADALFVDVRLPAMSPLHLLHPALAGLDMAVGLAVRAVVDDEMIGQAVDHPARPMRGVEDLGIAGSRGAVMNDDPLPVAHRRGCFGEGRQTNHHQDTKAQKEQSWRLRVLVVHSLSSTTYGFNSPASIFGIWARNTTLPLSIARSVT